MFWISLRRTSFRITGDYFLSPLRFSGQHEYGRRPLRIKVIIVSNDKCSGCNFILNVVEPLKIVTKETQPANGFENY